jgi:thioredoxin type arsenate reductase
MNKPSIFVVFSLPEVQTLLAQCVAEALGTFGLVFAGCGAIMIDAVSRGQVTHVGVGLVFGLIITVMIYAFGHISGAHFNPAVTLAFVLTRHFPIRRLFFYWAAQLVGAIFATLCLYLLLGNVASLGLTLPLNGDVWQSFAIETLLTFFLMIVIMAMATDTRAIGPAAALAIGGTIMLEALFAGPISGASMNPARSLAPALITGIWTAQWLYLFGPFLGAIAGALVYRYLREASKRPNATQYQAKESTSPIVWDKAAPPRESFFNKPAPKATGDPENAIWHPTASQTYSANIAPKQSPFESKAMPPYSQGHATTTTTNLQPMRVLFLCVHNSDRSQMAEGLLRLRGEDAYQIFSAGTYPTSVHPLAIKAMWEIGIDISTYRAKWLEEFVTEPPMDLVVTLCDEAAEACPSFPNARWQVHWSFPDPSQVTGTAEECLAAFRLVRDLIATKINGFPAHNPSPSPEPAPIATEVELHASR